MARAARFEGPDMTVPAGRVGLTMRLARQAAERERLLLPVVSIPQIPDKKAAK